MLYELVTVSLEFWFAHEHVSFYVIFSLPVFINFFLFHLFIPESILRFDILDIGHKRPKHVVYNTIH